ncbi:lysosomal protective protein-like isoform X1 [Gordionus sp. m RMFG-2023]|uniref:lysosomal protective protein-like isoform X1 n=1 Tax=Gordionus sp. m RMFG-2023 TaxID=3053472 RepID=UPI0031FDB571
MFLNLIAFFCIVRLVILQVQQSYDKIEYLPGYSNNISFNQYSGYLNGKSFRKLHYWFVESQNNPKKDPLLLWMNGGPGCSSLDGLLSELGPFHIKDKGDTLYNNPYSWNKVANVIFLEAPAGVGFSYAEDNNYSFNDDEVSLDNYEALKDFFQRFPQFSENELYITGESYAGIYVPTLTVRILRDMPQNGMNLKGFAIGNGLLSVTLNSQSILYFAYSHGIIGERLWRHILSNCCKTNVLYEEGPVSYKDVVISTCNFSIDTNPNCKANLTEAWRMIFDIGLNDYSLYLPCDNDPSNEIFHKYLYSLHKTFPYSYENWVETANRNYYNYKFPPYSNEVNRRESFNQNDLSANSIINETPPCIDASAMHRWLNKPEVRTALHISDKAGMWDVCSQQVGDSYKSIYENMYPQFDYILNYENGFGATDSRRDYKIRGLVYNGDTDLMCNFLGAQWFISNLNVTQEGKRIDWRYGKQVAGFVDYYDNLIFATVKGAGHMVPQWRPGQALHMISKFLKNEPL